MSDKQLFDAWWLEQTRRGDPDRRPNLVEDAFYAALMVNKTRVSALELALQDYMDACNYADKESLVSAIGAAHKRALALVPRRVYPPPQTSGEQP